MKDQQSGYKPYERTSPVKQGIYYPLEDVSRTGTGLCQSLIKSGVSKNIGFLTRKTILMKTLNTIITGESKTNLSLHELVDEAIKKSANIPVSSKSLIANNVSGDLYIKTNEDIVSSVIQGLLQSMIMNATDGDIHVSAQELFGNTVKVFVRDNNCYNTYAVACNLQNMVPLAEQIGGYLNITNQRQKITTLEFSFPVAKEEEGSGDED